MLNEAMSSDSIIKSIYQIQRNILRDIEVFSNNESAIVEYIIELGKSLPSLDSMYKTDFFLVYGCVSRTWIHGTVNGGKVRYMCDSDAIVTKGILSLLSRILNDQSTNDIINSNLFFIKEMNLLSILGQQRVFGLAAIIKKMKSIAISLQKTKRKPKDYSIQ